MNKFFKYSALIILLAAFTLTSCKTSKDQVAQKIEDIQSKTLENALLWKIEGNDLQVPSYL